MEKAICSHLDCDRPVQARGMCMSHYAKWHRAHRDEIARPTLEERFWGCVRKTETCWLWTGGKFGGTGYGAFQNGPKKEGAHRVAYRMLVGSIPEGAVLDHLCRVRHCVNPAHLEVTTHRENILRGTGMSARHAAQTHCKRGHEFTPENTYRDPKGRRKCRRCQRARNRAVYASPPPDEGISGRLF